MKHQFVKEYIGSNGHATKQLNNDIEELSERYDYKVVGHQVVTEKNTHGSITQIITIILVRWSEKD